MICKDVVALSMGLKCNQQDNFGFYNFLIWFAKDICVTFKCSYDYDKPVFVNWEHWFMSMWDIVYFTQSCGIYSLRPHWKSSIQKLKYENLELFSDS